jgi:hypothetical protein
MMIDDQITLMKQHIRQHRENGKHGKANKLAAQMLRTVANKLRHTEAKP